MRAGCAVRVPCLLLQTGPCTRTTLQEICYRNSLLGAFFQSGKTLPIQVTQLAAGDIAPTGCLPQLPALNCCQEPGACSGHKRAKYGRTGHPVMLLRLLLTLPLQRGGGTDQPIMRTVAAEVARGRWVHIFPEGKASSWGQVALAVAVPASQLGSCGKGCTGAPLWMLWYAQRANQALLCMLLLPCRSTTRGCWGRCGGVWASWCATRASTQTGGVGRRCGSEALVLTSLQLDTACTQP